MLSKIGWLARGGAATFTVLGFFLFELIETPWTAHIAMLLCFLTAAVFYGIDQITTAINSPKEGTSKLEE